MKLSKAIAGFVASLLFIVSVLPAAAVETESAIDLKSAQLYPVTTTDMWQDMSRLERVAACQLSEDDLQVMTTEDLLQCVLNNPFMIDIYAFSTYEMGFKHIYDEFEMLSLLVERDDYGEVLLDTYSSIPIESSLFTRSTTYYQNIWALSTLEILIAQPQMTETLSNAEISNLAAIVERKLIEKSNAVEVYGGSCAAFAQALSENPDSAIAVAVSSQVRTPAGSYVDVVDNSAIADWTSSERAALDSQTLTAYPTATLLRTASKKYNCHSYAWYSTSSSNHYWMEDPTVYMTDGSYDRATCQVGNIAYWYIPIGIITGQEPVHSGIVDVHMQSSAVYGARSKWGQLGVFNHRFDDCPYSGTISYWTEAQLFKTRSKGSSIMPRQNLFKNYKSIVITACVVLLLSLILFFGYFFFNYSVNNSMFNPGVYYIEETNQTYKYEYEMHGTLPNSTQSVLFYVYSNDPDLTFLEVCQTLLSSQLTSNEFYISEIQIPTKSQKNVKDIQWLAIDGDLTTSPRILLGVSDASDSLKFQIFAVKR